MAMSNDLVAAFGEFKDAAYAMGHFQLAQATAAAERLEAGCTTANSSGHRRTRRAGK